MGQSEEALSHLDRAIALLRKGLGSEHPEIAPLISNRGEVLNALGRYEEARRSFEMARGIWERELGPDHPYMSYALTGIGISYLGEGKASNALAPLEQALKIRLVSEPEPAERAETTFALARALWASGQSRARSRILAEEAQTSYERASVTNEAASVKSWLRAHP
jgi:serine/threonine-protein kinase